MANVLGFGAVGDGVADDTDALQHALNDGDGVLRLNKGTYRITKPLILDLSKQGFGAVRGEAGTSRIVMAGPGPALRVIGDHQGTASPASVQTRTWDQERFPTINGIEIVGEHPDAVGIELRKTLKCVISQVLVRRCKIAVHLVERNRDFILADSHLYDNHEIGLFFDHCNLHQSIVHGCHISWNKIAGIKSAGGDVHNLQIVGNDIEYNNATAGGKGKSSMEQADLVAASGRLRDLVRCNRRRDQRGHDQRQYDSSDRAERRGEYSHHRRRRATTAAGRLAEGAQGRHGASHQHHRQRARQSVAGGRASQCIADHDHRQHDLRLGRSVGVCHAVRRHRRRRQRVRVARFRFRTDERRAPL